DRGRSGGARPWRRRRGDAPAGGAPAAAVVAAPGALASARTGGGGGSAGLAVVARVDPGRRPPAHPDVPVGDARLDLVGEVLALAARHLLAALVPGEPDLDVGDPLEAQALGLDRSADLDVGALD